LKRDRAVGNRVAPPRAEASSAGLHRCIAGVGHYTGRVIRNVIFDWSGTLVDDLPAVWEATNYVLTQSKRATMSLEQFRAEFQLPFTTFYERHTPDVALEQLEEWFHSRFREVQDSVQAIPHAREFVRFCRARKMRLFVLSTVRPDHFAVQSRAAGLEDCFEKTYLGVRDKRPKIHEILDENRLAPDETLFVGDMKHDIEAARLGGVRSCAVLTGYNTLGDLRSAQPDVIVEHLGELQALLSRNGGDLPAGPLAGAPVVTVGALIFNDAGEVLLLRTHKWSDLWGIPGGKIQWGETAEAALRRELREETNLEVRDVRLVLVQDCIHSPEFYRDAHFVLLNYTCRCAAPAVVRLNDEAREFRWVRPAEALALPLNTPTRRLLQTVLQT
jgi:phosphoglycolate phosphatase-like HAD superfamily hydrolase/ADP-ribose pyrophosphatase YjhB (NUDIX family)